MASENTEQMRITVPNGGTLEAHVALPARLPAPGLLLLSEVFNVNEHMREVAAQYAANGFLVVAPDLYWRDHPGHYLPYTEEGVARARELWAQLDIEQFARDLQYIIDGVRSRPDCTGRIGALGFCLGGTFAFVASARYSINAAVSYYGIRIHERLDEVDRLSCPVLMHYASNDAHVPMEAVRRIQARAAATDRMLLHIYDGAVHGFNRRGYPAYHSESAALAHERTLAFLRERLF
jgi:carboxymethylenebutenolidase